MPYGDFKDLTRRTAADKILCNKACDIAKNPKYDGYQRFNALYIFDKKTSGWINLYRVVMILDSIRVKNFHFLTA